MWRRSPLYPSQVKMLAQDLRVEGACADRIKALDIFIYSYGRGMSERVRSLNGLPGTYILYNYTIVILSQNCGFYHDFLFVNLFTLNICVYEHSTCIQLHTCVS